VDRLLSGGAPGTMRFTNGASLCAIAFPVSVLLDNPESSVRWKEIRAVPIRDLHELILFVSSGVTTSDIGELLTLIAKQSPDSGPPDWIAIPASGTSPSAPFPEHQAKEPSGGLVIRDKEDQTASFNFYALESAPRPLSGLEPVKSKIPEPSGNLGARGEWFRRRSGGGQD